jgi:hypothetical protein
MRMSPRHLSVPALVGLLGAAAAACGGGSPTPQATTGTTQAASRSSSAGTGAPQAPPGVSGQVAAVNGSVLEVQDPTTGQTTVNLNGSTVITQTVTVTASALAVGQCVTASGTKTSAGPVAATTVTIDALVSGSCAGAPGAAFGGGPGGGFGGGAGGFGGRRAGTGGAAGGSTTRTTLSAAQRAQRQAQLANVGVSDGKITAINGTTVEVTVPPPPSTTSTTSTTRAGGGARFRVTPAASFTYTSSTRFMETRAATPSAVIVGDCVTAFGPSDTTGAVTAQRLTIRPAGPSGCSTGFGGGFGRGGGGGAGTGGAPGTGTGA